MPQYRMTPIRLAVESLESRDCPAGYGMIDLLPPVGATFSKGVGLNDNGVVAGFVAGTGPNRATVWQTGTASTATPVLLGAPAGWTAAFAADVNNASAVAGQSNQDATGIGRAILWVQSGSNWIYSDLGTLGASFPSSSANGLSERDAGNVTWVVGESVTADAVTHAAVWRVDTAGAVLSRIDLEPGLSMDSTAFDARVIGNMVYVAGEVSITGGSMARRWILDLNGNVISRTDLGTLGGSTSGAAAINGQGDVIGSSRPSNSPFYGYFYSNGSMTSVGSLGNYGSRAYGVNDSDIVVGSYFNLNNRTQQITNNAFVWQAGVMTDLKTQIVGTKAWSYTYVAIDVNASGSIVGSGRVKVGKTSEEHGYLARPVSALQTTEPSTGYSRTLSMDAVNSLGQEAKRRWQLTGADTSLLQAITIRIADLPGTTLGVASGNTIWLDTNAAGWGWFVDKTPRSDAEFLRRSNQGEQGRMDLLSVIMHEMGHVLGFDHHENGVMQETLAPGVRLLPEGMKLINTARDTADVVFALLQHRKAW